MATTQSDIDKALSGLTSAGGGGITGGATGMGSGIGGALGTLIGGGLGATGGPVGGMIGSSVGSMVGAGISAIPQLMRSDYEKESQKRLLELKRRQELGTLGLTEREKEALYLSGSEGITKAAQDIRALQGGTAASLATGAGVAASQKTMADEALIAQKAAVNKAIMEQDIAEKRAQEAELEQRKALASEAASRRAATRVSIAATGIGAIEEGLKLAKQVRGRAPTSSEIKAFQDYTGISDPAKAAQVFQLMGASSPEQQELLSGLLITPSKQGVVTSPSINIPIIK